MTISAFLLLSCGYRPASIPAEETRQLESFQGIGISISAQVIYTPGSKHEIKIEGEEQDVKELLTKVEDGYLKLRYEKNRMHRSRLIIHVTSKELEKLSISGSANVESTEPISSEEMNLAISGSGSIRFPALESEEVDVRISGSGNVSLEKGNAEEMDVKISGSGKVLAEKFEVSEFSASISGSGSCRITVEDELKARLSGSGSIFYKGDPQVNSTSSGSGKVRSL